MNGLSPHDLGNMPGVSQFLGRITADLSNRRSVLVLLPEGVPQAPLRQPLQEWLARNGFEYHRLPLAQLTNPASPIEALSDFLAVRWAPPSTPRTVANLMRSAEMPNVLMLDEVEHLDVPLRQNWMRLMGHWAETVHYLTDTGELTTPTSLCVVAPALAVRAILPNQDIFLALHAWWGFPSLLETRLLCRVMNDANPCDVKHRWRESILPALCGCDWSLVEFLWDKAQCDLSHLVDSLHEYAALRNWDGEALRTAGATQFVATHTDDGRQASQFPPVRWLALWQMGALYWTPECGLELHAAAMATLNEDQAIRHRLWRGQAEFVLPVLDVLRLRLCNHLTAHYGADWPVRWAEPDWEIDRQAVRNDPLAVEWGYLDWLLRTCSALSSERRWMPLAARARTIRNEIAHYRPIAFADFEELWREMGRVGIVLS